MIAANENTMLWARGLIDMPSFDPCEGADSCHVDGIFSHGWPVRIGPHQRLAIGVQQTSRDLRLRRYAVAVVAMQWQVGSWQVIGLCTAIAPGQSSEARAWFFGCWLVLQMVLGRHQLNHSSPSWLDGNSKRCGRPSGSRPVAQLARRRVGEAAAAPSAMEGDEASRQQ